MDHLTKEQIQSLMRREGKSPYWTGEFDLFVKSFGTSIPVSIALWNNDSLELSERTVQTINEVANLTDDHYQQILRLVFDDLESRNDEQTATDRDQVLKQSNVEIWHAQRPYESSADVIAGEATGDSTDQSQSRTNESRVSTAKRNVCAG